MAKEHANFLKKIDESHVELFKYLASKISNKNKKRQNTTNTTNTHNYTTNSTLHNNDTDTTLHNNTTDTILHNYTINNERTTTHTKKYPTFVRQFVLTLHYYLPRAYNYVRKYFRFSLPHPKSICRWYQSINGNPSFSKEALNSISNRVKVTDYPLIGTLVFDEMSIKREARYTGKSISGYIDFGDDTEKESTCLAKDALVFMFVCMNATWKVPVGYFFVNGVTTNQKKNLINQCLRVLHETGVKVAAITCDGANLSVMSHLQCNLNSYTNLVSSSSDK